MLSIKEIKERLKSIDRELVATRLALLAENKENQTIVYITDELILKCKKGKVWNSPALLGTLQNCWYGIDLLKSKSPGGRDGMFFIDRSYKPKNEMQRKIFDQYIDKENSSFNQICSYFNCNRENVQAVRVVSHHMRLLGFMFSSIKDEVEYQTVVLVDYDNTK